MYNKPAIKIDKLSIIKFYIFIDFINIGQCKTLNLFVYISLNMKSVINNVL